MKKTCPEISWFSLYTALEAISLSNIFVVVDHGYYFTKDKENFHFENAQYSCDPHTMVGVFSDEAHCTIPSVELLNFI